MKKIIVLLTAAVLGAAGSASPVNFADDLPHWKQLRIACEKNGECLRVNVLPNASGNFGQLWKNVEAVPSGKYLQINVRALENSGAFAWVNTPTLKRTFGVLFQGINTFAPMTEKRIALSINQLGARANPGAWISYESYEISDSPENSLVAVKEPAEGALKVGDTLKFKIFRRTPCVEPVSVRIYTTAQTGLDLQEFKLCGERSFEAVYNDAEKCYTACVKITADAYSLDSASSNLYVVAGATLDGLNTYFTMPFPIKLETAHKIPAALFTADSPETRENRQVWFDMTWGRKNLALHKPVKFTPRPRYRLTEDKAGEKGCDALDLTDGELTGRNNDKIWFDRRAVGFFDTGANEVIMRLDLGEVSPVDYVALRALGGGKTLFRWPKKFEVFVSQDGKTFFTAAEMTKLAPAEADQSDFVRTYFYPEERVWGDSVCKSFKLPVKADARYVIVKLTLDLNFFSDEMAVIAAERKDADFNRAYEGKGFLVPNDGLTAAPRLPELAVIKGVAAPQKFAVSDYRAEPGEVKNAQVVLELPAPLTLFGFTAEKITVGDKPYHRYRLPVGKKLDLGMVYILSDADTPDRLPPADIYVEYDGRTGFKQSLPLKIVTLPEFETFRKVPICLAWMTTETLMDSYPELLKNYTRLGFNSAGVFPRLWTRHSRALQSGIARNCEAVRQAGLKIFMNDSAIHEMIRTQKAGSEVYCLTPTPSMLTCPSYTGEFYQKEMERIARCVAMSKPDHVLLDIECFGHAFTRSVKECSRCKEAVARSGLSETEYLYGCGKRLLADIAAALAKGAKEANIPAPALHMYGLERTKNHHGICRFTDVYPEIIRSAQPSLYVGGHPAVVRASIRGNRKLLGKNDVMPWLTTGCYGEYDSYLVEPMVLEALMNGAGGILNYKFDFFADSPLDFYYHALAVKKLAPYEELLIHGEYPEIIGSNDKMFYSAVRRGNEMLLLVGNYYKASPATCVTLPFGKAKVLDLNTGKSFSAPKEFRFEVEPGKFSLFYITMQE